MTSLKESLMTAEVNDERIRTGRLKRCLVIENRFVPSRVRKMVLFY